MTEDFVSFKVAKLLKEKGFNISTLCYYREVDGGFDYPDETIGYLWNDMKGCVSAPTLQMACKWLREMHDLVIYTILIDDGDFNSESWGYKIFNKFTGETIKCTNLFTTYEAACNQAIRFCLDELI